MPRVPSGHGGRAIADLVAEELSSLLVGALVRRVARHGADAALKGAAVGAAIEEACAAMEARVERASEERGLKDGCCAGESSVLPCACSRTPVLLSSGRRRAVSRAPVVVQSARRGIGAVLSGGGALLTACSGWSVGDRRRALSGAPVQ